MREDERHQELCNHLGELGSSMRKVEDAIAASYLNGELLRFHFTAANLAQLDDQGQNALAYAVYNPNNFAVFLGTGGGGAAKDSFVVPKQKLVVAPITVNGAIQLLAEEAAIGEGGFVWRVRFPTPQPFFVGALA